MFRFPARSRKLDRKPHAVASSSFVRRKVGADGGAVSLNALNFRRKKQGAAGITTAAPHVAGRWGRGNDRLS